MLSLLDAVVAHHSQILVLKDVTVIQVKPRVVLELHEDLDALAGQNQDNVLESLIRKSSAKAIRVARRACYVAALYYSELKIVDVHGMGHGRVVDKFPDLSRAKPSSAGVRHRGAWHRCLWSIFFPLSEFLPEQETRITLSLEQTLFDSDRSQFSNDA